MALTLIRAFDHLMKSLRQYCKGKQENVLYRYVASKKKALVRLRADREQKKMLILNGRARARRGVAFWQFFNDKIGGLFKNQDFLASSIKLSPFFKGMVEGCDCVKGGEGGRSF